MGTPACGSERFIVCSRPASRSTIDAMNATHAIAGSAHAPVEHRRALARVLSVRGCAAFFVLFVGWSLSGPAPEPTPGASACREVSRGTTEDYLIGLACPPSGFSEALGYDPRLVQTPAGWRYTRPTEAVAAAVGHWAASAERWSS